MSAAKATIRCMDLGSGGLWKWAPTPGNGVTSAVMQCNAHVLCGVLVRTVRTSGGLFAFEACGTHSVEANLKRRQNAALTLAQEQVVVGAFRGLGWRRSVRLSGVGPRQGSALYHYKSVF